MNNRDTFSRRTVLRSTVIAGMAMFGRTAFPNVRPAVAQSGSGQHSCQYNSVRLRDNYGLSSNVIGVLNVGDVVNLTGDFIDADGYTWMPVTVNTTGTAGWTAVEFYAPVMDTTTWPEGTPVHVSSNNVNFRSGPGLGYAVIGNYDSGAGATILAGPEESDGYSWHNININGTVGWMATNFLTEGAGNGNNGGGWAPGTTVHVNTDALNLRDAPGINAEVKYPLAYGTNLTIADGPVQADGYTWYQISFPTALGSGWVAGDFLAEGNWNPEPTGDRLRVVDGPLNLRSQPNLEGHIVSSLEYGTVVQVASADFVDADGYTWMRVNVEGNPYVVGWIAQGFTGKI